MNENIPLSLHNKFVFEIEDINTKEIRTVEATNVVLDNFWIKQMYTHSWFKQLQIGDGSGVPSASDTTLFNKIATHSLANIKSEWSYDDLTYTRTGEVYLTETMLNGKNLSEVGLCVSVYQQGEILMTHAILTDMNGNPVVIQKTDTTRVRIYATVYIRVKPHSGSARYYNYGGCTLAQQFIDAQITNSYTCSVTGYRVYNYSASKGVGVSSNVTDPLTPKDVVYNVSTNKATFATSEANLDNIFLIGFGPLQWRLMEDWFVGERIIGEAVGTGDGSKKLFKTKYYGCVNPTIYIDGVVTTDYTVYPMSPIHGSFRNNIYDFSWVHVGYVDEVTGEPLLTGYYSTGGINLARGKQYMVLRNYLYEDGWACLPNFENTYGSNDLITWTPIPMRTSAVFKYIRITSASIASNRVMMDFQLVHPPALGKSLCNIVFNTPPPSGSVITIDYNPKTLRKSSDTTLALQFSGSLKLSPSGV